MKRFPSTHLVSLALALGSTEALATCEWDFGNAGVLVHNLRLNTTWVARDAPQGTVIGQADVRYNIPNDAGLTLVCNNVQGNEYLTANLTNTTPIFPGTLPLIGGEDLTGRVLETGVDGVGIHIRLDAPYTGAGGSPQNYWNASTWHSIPWEGYSDHRTGVTGIQMNNLRAFITLIKTGPIMPGPQSFNGIQLFSGSYSDVGDVLRYYLHGSVIAAQCIVRPNAVSADPVNLGSHPLKDFIGASYTTAPVSFSITLNDCDDDPRGSTTQAHIRLDGAQGSTVIDRDRGLFSLSSGSTATGLGIQILHADGSPVPLEQDVPMISLTPGDIEMPFQARYYQTDPSVTAGEAKGTLNFTMSYR